MSRRVFDRGQDVGNITFSETGNLVFKGAFFTLFPQSTVSSTVKPRAHLQIPCKIGWRTAVMLLYLVL